VGTFPQAGIITSLNMKERKAKTYLPLLGIETDWMPVATNLLFEEEVEGEGLEFMKIRIDPMNPLGIDEPHPEIGHTFALGHQGTVKAFALRRIVYGTIKVGDEAVVVFLNGDINNGVVVARL
jgi:hypothetical protein